MFIILLKSSIFSSKVIIEKLSNASLALKTAKSKSALSAKVISPIAFSFAGFDTITFSVPLG